MPLQIDVFLLVLRLLFIVLLYLFLMQVVIAITRDLRKADTAQAIAAKEVQPVLGHLVVVDSGPSNLLPGTSFNLAPETTIGRGPTNTIVLHDSFISGEHTRLWNQNGTWYVKDSGSRNGTFLNNFPVPDTHPVRVGDVVRVGFISFKLTP
jgi:pSer/pThr/pTyr-binding forkhead associated (FHA) protein